MAEHCPLCGRRLHKDQSQLVHEYSGRCLNVPAPKPPRKSRTTKVPLPPREEDE